MDWASAIPQLRCQSGKESADCKATIPSWRRDKLTNPFRPVTSHDKSIGFYDGLNVPILNGSLEPLGIGGVTALGVSDHITTTSLELSSWGTGWIKMDQDGSGWYRESTVEVRWWAFTSLNNPRVRACHCNQTGCSSSHKIFCSSLQLRGCIDMVCQVIWTGTGGKHWSDFFSIATHIYLSTRLFCSVATQTC